MPTGPEREVQIYAHGLGGGKPSAPVPPDLLEQQEKEALAPRACECVASGAVRGMRWIFGAGGDAGCAFTGLAREGPSLWLVAIYAAVRSRELFQRPGFSWAAGATAGAESDGGDPALGQLVFESGAHVEGYRTSAAAHAGADHPQRNIVCP